MVLIQRMDHILHFTARLHDKFLTVIGMSPCETYGPLTAYDGQYAIVTVYTNSTDCQAQTTLCISAVLLDIVNLLRLKMVQNQIHSTIIQIFTHE